MTVKTITIDLMAIATCVMALCAGFTGRVDWWVVTLVLLSMSHLKLTFTIR